MHIPESSASGDAVPSRVTVRHLVTLFVWAVAVALFFHFFAPFQVIFLGLLAAGCLASALYPLTCYIPAGRGVSALIVGLAPVLLLVGLVVLMTSLLAEPVKQQVGRWPEVRKRVDDSLGRTSQRLGLEKPVTLQTLIGQTGGTFGGQGGGGGEVITKTGNALSGIAIALALVFFGSIYLMSSRPAPLLAPILAPLPKERGVQIRAALHDLVPRLRWWVIGTLCAMLIVGVASYVGFRIIGLDFALPLAVLAGLGEIVPFVGPAAAFLIAIAFAATHSTSALIGVIVVYIIVQVVESYLLVPMVMKKAVEIPPVVTLFTVVLWGKIFGPAGLFLAIPINVVIWSFYDHLVLRPRTHEHAPA